MAERPILFNGEMVRAILDGRKTQTRRPVTPQPDGVRNRVVLEGTSNEWAAKQLARGHFVTAQYEADGSPLIGTARHVHCHAAQPCPHGIAGDRLWVRETFATEAGVDGMPEALVHYRANFVRRYGAWERDVAERSILRWERPWKPSIHMPRWASRLTLRVTDVRVERVQDITEADARAEGIEPATLRIDGLARQGFRIGFASLWSATYGPESWVANPWVWVVSFEKEEVIRG